jgi:hypothetical protein
MPFPKSESPGHGGITRRSDRGVRVLPAASPQPRFPVHGLAQGRDRRHGEQSGSLPRPRLREAQPLLKLRATVVVSVFRFATMLPRGFHGVLPKRAEQRELVAAVGEPRAHMLPLGDASAWATASSRVRSVNCSGTGGVQARSSHLDYRPSGERQHRLGQDETSRATCSFAG